MRKDAIGSGEYSVCEPPQNQMKISEHVSSYNSGDMGNFTRIDEREEEIRKRKADHRNIPEVSCRYL